MSSRGHLQVSPLAKRLGFRRIATRYDKLARNYFSALCLVVEPLIPPGKTGGGKRTVNIREVVNGLMYISLDRLSVARDPERPAAEKLGL